jgi:hypothetical protein
VIDDGCYTVLSFKLSFVFKILLALLVIPYYVYSFPYNSWN